MRAVVALLLVRGRGGRRRQRRGHPERLRRRRLARRGHGARTSRRSCRTGRCASRTAIGRHVTEGVALLRSEKTHLEHVVVVSLGTNDDPRRVSDFSTGLRQILAIAGPSRCVVWTNIVRPPAVGTSYDGFNRALSAAAATHRNLVVVDWQAIVRKHPAMAPRRRRARDRGGLPGARRGDRRGGRSAAARASLGQPRRPERGQDARREQEQGRDAEELVRHLGAAGRAAELRAELRVRGLERRSRSSPRGTGRPSSRRSPSAWPGRAAPGSSARTGRSRA